MEGGVFEKAPTTTSTYFPLRNERSAWARHGGVRFRNIFQIKDDKHLHIQIEGRTEG